METWESLTEDELKILEILHWIGKYTEPLTSQAIDANEELKDLSQKELCQRMGRGVSVKAFFQDEKSMIQERLAEIDTRLPEILQGTMPGILYKQKSVRFDTVSQSNPILTMLNHLSEQKYIELNRTMTTYQQALDADKAGELNFHNVAIKEQPNVFVSIRRRGIVASEKWIAHKEQLELQKQELAAQEADIAAQKAETEASKRIERIIGVMGGLAVLVAILEWNWAEGGTILNLFRFVAIGLVIALVVIYRDSVMTLLGGVSKTKTDTKD